MDIEQSNDFKCEKISAFFRKGLLDKKENAYLYAMFKIACRKNNDLWTGMLCALVDGEH